jgi:hypothetical protein
MRCEIPFAAVSEQLTKGIAIAGGIFYAETLKE